MAVFDAGRKFKSALDEEDSKQPSLPTLTAHPSVYPGSCLALSQPLLNNLSARLPKGPALVLSVGSGYGLLEALLLTPPYSINVVGVEVQPSSNRYLPATHHREVTGTRFLDDLADEADAWLFVYPKRVGLLDEYLKEFGKGKVELIVWAGPKADWEDYAGLLENGKLGVKWDVKAYSADEMGGAAWEMIAFARKV